MLVSSAKSRGKKKRVPIRDYSSHLFFLLCLASMIVIGITIILGICLYGKESFTAYTTIIGMLLLVSNILIFKSYLKHRKVAKETFRIVPCRKGILKKVRGHIEICIRCIVVYVFTLILMPITALLAQLGRNIWFELYTYVVSQYGLPTYILINVIFAILLPSHGTYIAITGKESNLFRFITAILFSISLFMLYAFLAMNIFKA